MHRSSWLAFLKIPLNSAEPAVQAEETGLPVSKTAGTIERLTRYAIH